MAKDAAHVAAWGTTGLCGKVAQESNMDLPSA